LYVIKYTADYQSWQLLNRMFNESSTEQHMKTTFGNDEYTSTL
jgi:hypothetical protein